LPHRRGEPFVQCPDFSLVKLLTLRFYGGVRGLLSCAEASERNQNRTADTDEGRDSSDDRGLYLRVHKRNLVQLAACRPFSLAGRVTGDWTRSGADRKCEPDIIPGDVITRDAGQSFITSAPDHARW